MADLAPPYAVRLSVCRLMPIKPATWPAACMELSAISVSHHVLNEIAWSPGDPGTGAPSFLGPLLRKFPLAPSLPLSQMNEPAATLSDPPGA
jgi:hypothetical protein